MLFHYPLLCITLKWISWDATRSSQKVLGKAVRVGSIQREHPGTEVVNSVLWIWVAVQILMCLFPVVKSEKLTYSPVVLISTIISVDTVRSFHFECKNIRAAFSGEQGDEGKVFVHGISDKICPSLEFTWIPNWSLALLKIGAKSGDKFRLGL